ncbi:hypothetical protein MYX82_14680 [Acidobacteria bacterium AH-259-D05]|nr:hypothetical protein [Acidobacteria bacterium AH-259-D05]
MSEAVTVRKNDFDEVYDAWMQLAHIVEIMDQEKHFDVYQLLEPIKRRMGEALVCGDFLAEKEVDDGDNKIPQEITVPVPLKQLEAVHQIWIEFASIITITDRNETEADSLMNLLEPLNERLSDIVFEEWETLIHKAEKSPQEGGAA